MAMTYQHDSSHDHSEAEQFVEDPSCSLRDLLTTKTPDSSPQAFLSLKSYCGTGCLNTRWHFCITTSSFDA